MLHADELQKSQNQIPFPLALLESVRMPQAMSTSSTMEYAGLMKFRSLGLKCSSAWSPHWGL